MLSKDKRAPKQTEYGRKEMVFENIFSHAFTDLYGT